MVRFFSIIVTSPHKDEGNTIFASWDLKCGEPWWWGEGYIGGGTLLFSLRGGSSEV